MIDSVWFRPWCLIGMIVTVGGLWWMAETAPERQGPVWIIPLVVFVFWVVLWVCCAHDDRDERIWQAEERERELLTAVPEPTNVKPWTDQERRELGIDDTDRWITDTDRLLRGLEWDADRPDPAYTITAGTITVDKIWATLPNEPVRRCGHDIEQHDPSYDCTESWDPGQ